MIVFVLEHSSLFKNFLSVDLIFLFIDLILQVVLLFSKAVHTVDNIIYLLCFFFDFVFKLQLSVEQFFVQSLDTMWELLNLLALLIKHPSKMV